MKLNRSNIYLIEMKCESMETKFESGPMALISREEHRQHEKEKRNREIDLCVIYVYTRIGRQIHCLQQFDSC